MITQFQSEAESSVIISQSMIINKAQFILDIMARGCHNT